MRITGGEHPEPEDDGEVLGVLTGQVKMPVPDDTEEDNDG